jgi:hypothetical protein
MEGPLHSVAALENACPPGGIMITIEPHVAEFLDSLHALNKKDELLACVLYECDLLPHCIEACLGWCE